MIQYADFFVISIDLRNKMDRFISKNILYLMVGIFLLVGIVQFYFTYSANIKEQNKMAYEHSKMLADFAITNRNYYQNLYLKNIIPLTKKTIEGLPAYSLLIISKQFSKINIKNIYINTVSDNPRNPRNMADSSELKAIDSFKKDKNKKEYFKTYDNFFQYAVPLKINKTCLKCHGKREDAPKFIKDSYSNAYGYKLGDIRGILSIKIPKESVSKYFNRVLWQDSIKNILLLIVLFVFVVYISKKNANFNQILQEMVDKKSSQIIEKEKHIIYLNLNDQLTGLPNRNSLKDDLKKTKSIKLAYFNIDNFKDINDFYGIHTGDKILLEYAKKLKELSKKLNLVIYKLPSDEFALLCSDENISKDEFIKNIKNILSALNEYQFVIEDNQIVLTSTVGISLEEDQAMSKADIALKRAKIYHIDLMVYKKDDNIEHQIQKNLHMIKQIKTALQNNNIIPFFQPIKDIKNNSITKYEALVRLINSNGDTVSPYEFLDIAKKAKLYPKITKAVLEQTIQKLQLYPNISFSINLSIEDIEDKTTVELIGDKLSNIPNPQNIVFEILESEKITNYDAIKSFIQKHKKIGCRFAIDDFGSGYSNFAHLIELDIDFIKIDASLIKNIDKDTTSYEIVKSIVEFSKILKVKTVAEFVSSKEVYDIVKEMDIDYAQGYYISKPKREIE